MKPLKSVTLNGAQRAAAGHAASGRNRQGLLAGETSQQGDTGVLREGAQRGPRHGAVLITLGTPTPPNLFQKSQRLFHVLTYLSDRTLFGFGLLPSLRVRRGSEGSTHGQDLDFKDSLVKLKYPSLSFASSFLVPWIVP